MPDGTQQPAVAGTIMKVDMVNMVPTVNQSVNKSLTLDTKPFADKFNAIK